jgi:hypothetical protein
MMTLQDPSIVVIQYYTLIGEHLYQQAYQLLGSYERRKSPYDDFALGMDQGYKVVKVLKVVRFNDWIKQNHSNMVPAKDNVYYEQLYVKGYDMAEMAPVDGIVESYAWTIRENGEVKLEFHGKLPYDEPSGY